MKKIKIEKKIIGKGEPCFVIAEAGVNHNGNLKLAKKLIEKAKIAGADAVKFQTFKAENLVTEGAEMADYQKKNTKKRGNQLEMLKKLELDYEDFKKLKKYCDLKKIIFLSTPHSEDAVDFLEPLVSAYKVGSGDLTNIPFLEKVAEKKKPIILSTGMSTLKEVKSAVKRILRINKKLILLHCTTNYPCPLEEINLRAMLQLKKDINLPVGYSDHSAGIIVSIMAVSLGAVIIEKHFTLSRKLPGPDHQASLEPGELKKMIIAIRNTEKALGSNIKKPTKSEEKIKKVVRKSIIAKINILKGSRIFKKELLIKRPEGGISPEQINKVLGQRALVNIKKDELITWKKIGK